jgi:protein-S-isoprenylcysteine O-methyltransferase
LQQFNVDHATSSLTSRRSLGDKMAHLFHVPLQVWLSILYLSFAVWGLMEFWVFRRDRRQVVGQRADRGSVLWIIVAVYVSVGAAYYAVFNLPQARIDGPEPLAFLAGIGLMWAGMGFRLWAILTLGAFFRTSVVIQDEHRLITTGPYRRLRNPSYTGALMTMAGLGLALGNWASLGVLVGGPLLAYGWRIKVEEGALRSRFGETYDDYIRHTWSLIPFVW